MPSDMRWASRPGFGLRTAEGKIPQGERPLTTRPQQAHGPTCMATRASGPLLQVDV